MSTTAAGESDIRLDAAASLMLLSSRRKGISYVPFRSVATFPTFLHNGYETLGSIMCAVFTSGKKDIVTHQLRVCSCNECPEGEELKCSGKPYESRSVLRCDLHSLAYEIECNHRANHATEIIDPELGRGH